MNPTFYLQTWCTKWAFISRLESVRDICKFQCGMRIKDASVFQGPKNATKYYIACQAPIESTVTDFWRMIWEQQSKVIIMLTDLIENGVEKCTEYIPPSEVTDCHRLYGDYQVTLKKRETKEKYAISTLHLKVKIYS